MGREVRTEERLTPARLKVNTTGSMDRIELTKSAMSATWFNAARGVTSLAVPAAGLYVKCRENAPLCNSTG